MAGDGDDEAARADGVDRPGEEIIVDVPLGIILVAGVENVDIPEGEVGDDQVGRVVGDPADLLESHDLDVRLGVETSKDEAGKPVFLDGDQVGFLGQALGHEAQDVADAGGRLDDRAALESRGAARSARGPFR